MGPRVDTDRVWALQIIEGASVELPVEIYVSHEVALREARRWAWTIAGHGEIQIDRPSVESWRVGMRDVRLVACAVTNFDPNREWWVGSHWTGDGYADAEAELLPGRAAARSWTLRPPDDGSLVSHAEYAWSVVASFAQGNELSHSISTLAKVVMGPDVVGSPPLVEYRVDLTGTFVQGFNASLFAPPGLTRQALEEVIEGSWGEFSAGSHVLLESSWELESYVELPPS
jgi:hypothetical protein